MHQNAFYALLCIFDVSIALVHMSELMLANMSNDDIERVVLYSVSSLIAFGLVVTTATSLAIVFCCFRQGEIFASNKGEICFLPPLPSLNPSESYISISTILPLLPSLIFSLLPLTVFPCSRYMCCTAPANTSPKQPEVNYCTYPLLTQSANLHHPACDMPHALLQSTTSPRQW